VLQVYKATNIDALVTYEITVAKLLQISGNKCMRW
jgi:hypothetical protein